MTEKYVFTGETKNVGLITNPHTVRRIKRCSDGELGGWIEDELSLAQEGNCWVADEAVVYGGSSVQGNAVVSGNAIICNSSFVKDEALVTGEALVDNGVVCGRAKIFDSVTIHGADIYGPTVIKDNASVYGKAQISDGSYICGNARISGKSCVWGSRVDGKARVYGNSNVGSCSTVTGSATVCGECSVLSSRIAGNAKVYGHCIIDCSWIVDNACVHGYARIEERSRVYDNADVSGKVTIGNSEVYGVAKIDGSEWSELHNGRVAGNFWDHPQLVRTDAEKIVPETTSLIDQKFDQLRLQAYMESGTYPQKPSKEMLDMLFPSENDDSFLVYGTGDEPPEISDDPDAPKL